MGGRGHSVVNITQVHKKVGTIKEMDVEQWYTVKQENCK